MTRFNLFHGDVQKYPDSHQGGPFHAALCDTPYHLTTADRFGKPGSAPANTPLGRRMSGGFLHEDWDGSNFVSFQKETWQAISSVLYDGALIIACGHLRTYDRMKAAMREAGLIVYPDVICWAYGSGMSLPTRIDRFIPDSDPGGDEGDQGDSDSDIDAWAGYHYGLDILKPAIEPWVIAQKPWPDRPMDSIIQNGAGVANLNGASFTGKDGITRRPSTFLYTHSSYCLPERCAQDCPGRNLEGKQDYFYGAYWFHEVIEQVLAAPPIMYFPKPKANERDAGCDNLPAMGKRRLNPGGLSTNERWQDVEDAKNGHPTAKPIDLTKQLAKILLPPGVIGERRLYVPFAGVGSEMIGGLLAGWDFVQGIEITEKYIPVGNARLNFWLKQLEAGFSDPATIVKNWRLSREKLQSYIFG